MDSCQESSYTSVERQFMEPINSSSYFMVPYAITNNAVA